VNGPTVPQQVGSRVREAREAAGMTQAQLALRAGFTRGAIGHLETGRRDTTVTRLVAIAGIVHLDLGALFRELRLEHSDPVRRVA